MDTAKNIKRLLRYGRFGAFYGSWAGSALGCLITLYGAGETLYHWPEDGTIVWFLGGVFSILMCSFLGGYILGSIGGFVFGLGGSISNHPLSWSISGIAGGLVSSWFAMWLLWSVVRHRDIPDFPTFWLDRLPMNLAPCAILGVIGWFIGQALRRGHPNLPHLSWIQGL